MTCTALCDYALHDELGLVPAVACAYIVIGIPCRGDARLHASKIYQQLRAACIGSARPNRG